MKDIRELAPFDRPREKLEKDGAKKLSNIELVAALIGNGVKGKKVLTISRDIVKLIEKKPSNINLENLQKIEGIGKAKACQMVAAIELAKRLLIKNDITITKAKDVIKIVTELKNKKQEYFLTLTLDGANNLIQKRIVFIGTLNETIVHPREIFADAITDRAANIILVHNHPSGSLHPSNADIKTTSRLKEAGEILGIRILDHIIIAKNGYFSFAEENML